MNEDKFVKQWFKSWRKHYSFRRRRSPTTGPPDAPVNRFSPARRRHPPWVGTNREYGISDPELLDYILCQKYHLEVSPPSAIVKDIVQVPDVLAAPFQRKLYVRLLRMGGVFDVNKTREIPHFYIASQKNLQSSILRGNLSAVSVGNILQGLPRPPLWKHRSLDLFYFPPSHFLAAFAKSAPAIVIQDVRSGAQGVGKVDRSNIRKKMKAAFFNAYCGAQGITRETMSWRNVNSLDYMNDTENLAFLLDDARHPSVVREEMERMAEDHEHDEHESFLTKRDPRHIKGIDGVYIFRINFFIDYSNESLQKRMELAILSVIHEYGYVDPDQMSEWKGQQGTGGDDRDESRNIAEAAAYSRTSLPPKNWVYQKNLQFINHLPSLNTPGNEEEWERVCKLAMKRINASQLDFVLESKRMQENNRLEEDGS